MKTEKILITLTLAAATALTAMAGEVIIKPSRYSPPAKALFETPAPAKTAPGCALCKNELVSTTTQDTKLRTKTALIENHGCASCKTAMKTVGTKAFPKEVAEHSCAGRVAAVGTCCANMPGMN